MTDPVSRRLFLAALMAGAALPGWAAAPTQSPRPVARDGAAPRRSVPDARALIDAARLDGQVAFSVADVRTGLVLEEGAPTVALPPASVLKSVTALYALDNLGPGYRFRTRVIGTGGVSGGVVRGDLVLVGGGDPMLATDDLAALAAALKRAGIREVKGRFLVFGGALPGLKEIDRDQPDHVGYNPALSGLNLNFNRVHFQWVRKGKGWDVTMDARSDRYRPEVRVAAMSLVDRDLPVYTYRDGGDRDLWTVARPALGRDGSRWLPVRKPEIYASEVFATFTRAQGIVLKRPEPVARLPEGTVLAEHASDVLSEVLRDMLKYSTNLTAECVGLTATIARRGVARGLADSGTEMARWAQGALGMGNARFVDHSGLGEDSRVTARSLAAALVKARRSGLHPLLKDIDFRDDRGRPLKSQPVAVRAKTGTLNFVSGLAGYAAAKEGTELAFAIFAADTARRRRIRPEDRERPEGAGAWNARAKRLQQDLLLRWSALYGS